MQNLRRKSKGVRGRGLKTLWKWATEHSFFVFIFDIYYIAWKIVKYIMSYTDMHHWYNFLKNLNLLSLIWGHLSSLQLRKNIALSQNLSGEENVAEVALRVTRLLFETVVRIKCRARLNKLKTALI